MSEARERWKRKQREAARRRVEVTLAEMEGRTEEDRRAAREIRMDVEEGP